MKLTLLLPVSALLLGASIVAAIPGPSSPDPIKNLIVVSSDTKTVSRRSVVQRDTTNQTEPTRTCYNTGSYIGRPFAYAAIKAFCRSIMLAPGLSKTGTYTWTGSNMTMFIAAEKITDGCMTQLGQTECLRLLSIPINECAFTSDTTQGGYEMFGECGQWTADPGTNGTRY